jgi:hypothetical protein
MGMRLVAADVESTGLDRDRCQVISFSLVVDELGSDVPPDRLPALNLWVRHPGGMWWEPVALGMHAAVVPDLVNPKVSSIGGVPVVRDGVEVVKRVRDFFAGWPVEDGFVRPTFAGKNPGFDLAFLRPYLHSAGVKPRHRAIDPAVWFLRDGDGAVPSLEECLARAGLEPSGLHTAWGDALDVVRLVRAGWRGGRDTDGKG